MKKLKLFCLPYAGGTATIYTRWRKYLYHNIELYPLELMGRGKFFDIPFYNSLKDAVCDIFDRVKEELDGTPYAIFGHSMGSILAYELVNKIIAEHFYSPIHIFFSGRYPPHIKKERKIFHLLPEEEFKKEILTYDGTPEQVFEDKELSNLFIPILRSDYKLLETHEHISQNKKYDFDITVLSGKKDPEVALNDLIQWNDYTEKGCNIVEFEGGHFFIHERLEDVVKVINDSLREYRDLKIRNT